MNSESRSTNFCEQQIFWDLWQNKNEIELLFILAPLDLSLSKIFLLRNRYNPNCIQKFLKPITFMLQQIFLYMQKTLFIYLF